MGSETFDQISEIWGVGQTGQTREDDGAPGRSRLAVMSCAGHDGPPRMLVSVLRVKDRLDPDTF